MSMVGQCRSWELETDLVSHGHEHWDLFPTVPERSRFNQRRCNLMQAINCGRPLVLRLLEAAQAQYGTIDRWPVEHLQLLVTLNCVMLDFVLAPAPAVSLCVGEELLSEHTDLVVIGDKGYSSRRVATTLAELNLLQLPTIPGRNQQQLPRAVAHLLYARRQIIEPVPGQLTEQLGI